jgi:hypothetical protein
VLFFCGVQLVLRSGVLTTLDLDEMVYLVASTRDVLLSSL